MRKLVESMNTAASNNPFTTLVIWVASIVMLAWASWEALAFWYTTASQPDSASLVTDSAFVVGIVLATFDLFLTVRLWNILKQEWDCLDL